MCHLVWELVRKSTSADMEVTMIFPFNIRNKFGKFAGLNKATRFPGLLAESNLMEFLKPENKYRTPNKLSSVKITRELSTNIML